MSIIVPSFIPSSPDEPRIAFLGEAPGAEEEKKRVPFVGASGKELARMANQAGIIFNGCYRGNVFSQRPLANKVERFYVSKKELPSDYTLPPVAKGKYVAPEHLELDRIREELLAFRPNVVITLGNSALWAMCGIYGISKFRGSVLESTLIPDLKVLPTFHPAAVLRAWDLRTVTVADLVKARREAEFPEIRRPKREIWVAPNTDDLWYFKKQYLDSADLIACDLETAKHRFITCVGWAPSKDLALVVPFVHRSREGYHYWPTLEEEIEAWRFTRDVAQGPVPKLFQNGTYDLYFLYQHGIKVHNYLHDTMLEHHAWQPEMLKSLSFMGSLHTDEVSWKLLNPGKIDAKRED